MAYNEFLETTVEFGVIGLIGFLSFYSLLGIQISKHWKDQEDSLFFKASSIGVISFFLMSFVNFTIQAIPAFILFLVLASKILSKASFIIQHTHSYPLKFIITRLSLAFIGFFSILISINQAYFQFKNKTAGIMIAKRKFIPALKVLKDGATSLKSSESYWANLAIAEFEAGSKPAGLIALQQAEKITSNPEVFILQAGMYEYFERFSESRKYNRKVQAGLLLF